MALSYESSGVSYDQLDAFKRACQQAGMDGFLTKPVDPAELEEMFLMLFPSEERSHIVAA